jgi:hypothetical protein
MTTKGVQHLTRVVSEAQGQLPPTCCQTHSVSHVPLIDGGITGQEHTHLRTGGTVEVNDNLETSIPGVCKYRELSSPPHCRINDYLPH